MRSNLRRIGQLVVIVFGLTGALIASGAMTATASVRLVRVGSAASIPAGARALGALPTSTSLQLTVALRPQDPSGLQDLATAVSTPGSPEYRHYLTVSEFAGRFGATDQQVAAVESSLRAGGLTVGDVPANRLTIPVTGSAEQVEKAFSVSLAQVKLSSGRVTYANTSAPKLAANLADAVRGVIGLDGTVRDQPESLHPASSALHRTGSALRRPAAAAADAPQAATGGPQPCAAAQQDASGAGYTADTIASAYQFSNLFLAGDQGAGQTIAMFELQPYDTNDIAQYQLCYGTHVPVTDVNVDGGPGPYQVGTSDDGEAALDIEQAITTASGASVLVYQAPNSTAGSTDAYSKIMSDNVAKVISSSWGGCEARHVTGGGTQIQTENTLFQEGAVQGQTVFIASGDSGSAACYQSDHTNTGLSVQDPSAQPFVTAVGGTILFTGSVGSPQYYTPGSSPLEGVWNEGTQSNGTAGASTGGLSTQWAMPSYQQSAASSVGVINASSIQPGISCGSTYCREVPDVSADASAATGYAVYANGQNGGGWTIIGGTSAAAPLWAAYTALVNASATCRGQTVGFINPFLYSIAGSAYRTNLTDITNPDPISGFASNDAIQANNNIYPVTANYDMATGLGSMIGPALGSSLCSLASPVYTVSVASPGNQSTIVGQPVSLAVPGVDSGGAALAYTATGLPPGLAINAANGAVTGTPTTLGSFTVVVSAHDKYTNAGSSPPFTWAVAPLPVGKPTSSGVSLGGLASHKPTLKFTLAAGLNAPALKSVSVTLPGGLSFAKKAKSLSKGISVKNGGKKLKFKLAVKGGALTITLKSSARTLTVKIGKPAISVGGSLASKVKHHKVKKLTVRLKATDTSKKSTTYSPKLKVK